MKKTLGVVAAAALCLTLAGCNNATKKANNSASLRVHHVNYHGNLKAESLSPRQTAAAVLVYAADKYPDDWEDTLNNARSSHLNIMLKNSSQFSYINHGSGVAYWLGSSSIYTLKEKGSGAKNKIVYIFNDQKQLAAASVQKIVSYLNTKKNQDKLVNKLAKRAAINGQVNSDRTTKSNLAGDAGLFDVPAGLQGSWYSMDEGKMQKLTITQHSVINGQEEIPLHKMKAGFDFEKMNSDKAYTKKTQSWGRVQMATVSGITYMNVRGWLQGAGDGQSYGLKTLNGQTALVSASGAGPWVDAVYWRDENTARHYAHKKFHNLHYRDLD